MAQRALWISTSTSTRGGIATYVRAIRQTPLWSEWNIRHISTHRDGSNLAKASIFAGGALSLIVELIRFRPAVLHIHTSADASFVRKAILFWISRPARVPVVIHMHASNFTGFYDKSPPIVQAVIRATLRRAAAVIALGEYRAAELRRIAPTVRAVVIPNAVAPGPRTTQPRPDEPVHVVFAGRIGDRKGTFRLLDAWAKQSRNAFPDTDFARAAVLTIAGDGEVERARNLVRELDITETVEVRGWQSEADVRDLLDRSHVLVLPSRNEGQPMAVLEAMARGLCVVASDVGGLPEMIGGGCGVMISPDDIDALAAALQLVITQEDARVGFGAAAHERFTEQFDVGTVWHRLDDLYREVTQ